MNTMTQNYVSISPIRVSYNDTTDATKLFVISQNDNLNSECTFLFLLKDNSNKLLKGGNIRMAGTDYTNWSGDNYTPYTYVASKINVTIVTNGTSGTAGSSGSSGRS